MITLFLIEICEREVRLANGEAEQENIYYMSSLKNQNSRESYVISDFLYTQIEYNCTSTKLGHMIEKIKKVKAIVKSLNCQETKKKFVK